MPIPVVESKLPDVGTTIFTVMYALAARHGAVNLSQGFPDFGVPEGLLHAVERALADGHNQYAPMAGLPALRERIASRISGRLGIAVDPEAEITVTSGGTEALFDAISAIVRPGDEAILLDPAYDSYEPAVRLAGGRAVRIPLLLPSFSVDWERVGEAVTPRTRLIAVNTPHNPTGTVLGAEDLAALEALACTHGLFVLSDEVYEHVLFDGLLHRGVLGRPALRERAFAVYSFGKTYHATGWKVGYCVAPPALTRELRKVHQFVTFCTNTPVQHALAVYMAEVPDHADSLPAFFQAKRDRLLSWLSRSRFRALPSKGTYFQIADYSELSDEDDAAFCRRMTEAHGIAAIPVSAFYENPPAGMRLVRFCFAKSEDTLDRAGAILARM